MQQKNAGSNEGRVSTSHVDPSGSGSDGPQVSAKKLKREIDPNHIVSPTGSESRSTNSVKVDVWNEEEGKQ